MGASLVIFIISLLLTAFLTPWAGRLAIMLGFVDMPAGRKMHSTPMPLLGGVAIFGGAIIAVLAFRSQLPVRAGAVFLSGSVVALVGLLDDRRNLSPAAKLAGQFVAFVILALADIRVRLPVPEALNYAITFLWLAGISNAINFLDNMDGLSAGVSAVAASFTLVLGLQNDQFLVSALSAAVLGACLGFLRHNFRPASIFMGDAGALFLGFLLAVMGLQLRFPDNVAFVTWMVPVFIMAVPIFDVTLVVYSRLRRRDRIGKAGKDHTSHRLVDRGFSQREAVLILYLVTGATGMIGLIITQATVGEGYALGFTGAIIAAIAIWWLDR